MNQRQGETVGYVFGLLALVMLALVVVGIVIATPSGGLLASTAFIAMFVFGAFALMFLT